MPPLSLDDDCHPTELPSSAEVNIDECDSLPVVTSPLSDMSELSFGPDSAAARELGLTSPNLVSSMNRGET